MALSQTPYRERQEIDAYVLGVFEPRDRFEGQCIAVIHRTNDDDDKLIVVPEGQEYTMRRSRINRVSGTVLRINHPPLNYPVTIATDLVIPIERDTLCLYSVEIH